MSDMKAEMNHDLLESLITTIRNEELNYAFIIGNDDRVYGAARIDKTDPAKPTTIQIKDFDQIAAAIKADFDQGAKSAIRQKKDLKSYKLADKYLSGLVLVRQEEDKKEESTQAYSKLQNLLPKNMSVTDWLRTCYGVAVYDETSNTIIRRNENESGLAQSGIASVTNDNKGSGADTSTEAIWDALLTDTKDNDGKTTISLIRKVARTREEAEELIDETAKKSGDENKARSELDKKVKEKKGKDSNVDDWLKDEYKGGDAQQDGKTWNGEDSGKGSDNYMWIWLLGIGLCLAAEYAVWKKRKEK